MVIITLLKSKYILIENYIIFISYGKYAFGVIVF